MEWVLPVQKLTVGNIALSPPGSRPIAALSYNDGATFCHPSLSIMIPPLSVKSYDSTTGRLVLDTSSNHLSLKLQIKLQMLQDMLQEAIQYNQSTWFSTSYRTEEIRCGFQPLYEDSCLILHCNLRQGQDTALPIWSPSGWRAAKEEDFAVGSKVRIALKIQGISFLFRNDQTTWTSKSRVQHRILGIIPLLNHT